MRSTFPRSRRLRSLAPLVALPGLLAACPETPREGTTTDAGTTPHTDAAPQGDGQAPVQVDRGPSELAIEGDPNGLFWDEKSQTLYVADDNGNRILKWTDKESFSLIADLPKAGGEGAGLGQLVPLSDGSIVVTRFGYGTVGDIVEIPSGKAHRIIPNLDPTRRRIGLTVASDGRLFDSWFVRTAAGAHAGSIGELTREGTEKEVVQGLKKPVGVLAVGDSIYVSDQDLGQILKAPLATPASYTVFANVAGPDLLAAGPSGSLFTGSAGTQLYIVTSKGEPSVFKSGFQSVRGVAYDSTNKRVFVADHDSDESNGVHHAIRILPVD